MAAVEKFQFKRYNLLKMDEVINVMMEALVNIMEEPLLNLQPIANLQPPNANQQGNRTASAYNQALGDSQNTATAMLKKKNLKDHVIKSQISGIPPRWNRVLVVPVEKNIYREHVTTAQRSEQEVNDYRLGNKIAISGRGVPKPMVNLEEVNVPDSIIEWLQTRNRGCLTSIESQCWPIALSGRDLLAVVEAVSEAKAVAYLVPAVSHVLSQPPLQSGDGPTALVLVATSEMAQKVHQVACDIQGYTKVGAACLSCREPKKPQLEELEKRPQICIATPGRLLFFLKEGRLSLSRCTHVVFDGADVMVDMGLEIQIQAITQWIRPDHQTQIWLTSRTLNVYPLCEDLLNDYIQVRIDVKPELRDETVEQIVFVCDEGEKSERLVELLQDILNEPQHKVMVFAETRQTVDDIVTLLMLRELPVIGIHGKKRDEQQDWALASFQSKGVLIIVSTDMYARKPDVSGDVRFVINYDYPRSSELYMRRLGHASHAGQTAVAYTFFTHQDKRHASDLVSILREARQPVPVELKEMVKGGGRNRKLGAGRRSK